MTARRIKNSIKRQLIFSLSQWFGGKFRKIRSTLQTEKNLLHHKTSQWGAQQLTHIGRLRQKIYT